MANLKAEAHPAQPSHSCLQIIFVLVITVKLTVYCGWPASRVSSVNFCFQTVIFGNSSDFPFPNAVFLLPPAKPEAPPAPVQEKPLLSEEEIERKCKSIIDEFLHINDFKVSNVRSLLSRRVCSCGASAETMVPSSPRGHSSSGTWWRLGGSSSVGVSCLTGSRENGPVCVLWAARCMYIRHESLSSSILTAILEAEELVGKQTEVFI